MLLRVCVLICCAVVVAGFGDLCDYNAYKCGAWSDGDVMIGMLSSCYSKVTNLYSRERPEIYNCSDFSTASFVRMLAVIYTIETINNSSFLPGVRLGYYICDTCSHGSKAIQSAEHMLALNVTQSSPCGLKEKPMVKAIIGARYSEVSISVARFLSLYMVPQISASSSAETLSDRLRYPTFLRTVPSDIYQTKALAKLMSHFEWDWIGVVHGDDDYGKNALQGFQDAAEKENVCAEFIETLPYYLDHKDTNTMINNVIKTIQSSKANVVLLILREELVYKLFTEAINQNISRTWIGSDAWSMSQNITQIKGINGIGNIIGLSFITGPNPGLQEYLQTLSIPPGTQNKFIEEYKNLEKKEVLTSMVTIGQDYADRLAVLSIAHALRKVLDCNETACQGNLNFPPWKLLNELRLINFSVDNQTFYFNTSGNFVNGYHLINWVKNTSNEQRFLAVVGEYNLEGERIKIDADIIWYESNNTKPVSICSEICPPGTAKKLSKPSCCHNCIPCLEGTYSNDTNLAECLPCKNGTWSLKGSTYCEPKREEFWKWNGSRAITLLVFSIAGYLLLIINLIIYIAFRESPVMKQAGGYIHLLIMAGLALSFTSILMFIGKPSDHLCRARQVVYGLGFSLTVSCVLVKALRTFIAFLPRYRQHTVKKIYKPPIIIGFGTFIQVLICTFWLIFDSPAMHITNEPNDPMVITLQCKEGSGIGFGIMLSYIALLAFICFVLAFKSRKVPHRFNEAAHIILSMLVYLFVWVFFMPIYIKKILEHFAIQAVAILLSSYGIIVFHFAPKWYMALCKKKDEVTVEAYIARACENRPSIDSVFSNLSGVGPIMLKTGLQSRFSQRSTDSSDAGVGSLRSNDSVLDLKNCRKYQSSIRYRFHRRSI